jgi:hypothetical protein
MLISLVNPKGQIFDEGHREGVEGTWVSNDVYSEDGIGLFITTDTQGAINSNSIGSYFGFICSENFHCIIGTCH